MIDRCDDWWKQQIEEAKREREKATYRHLKGKQQNRFRPQKFITFNGICWICGQEKVCRTGKGGIWVCIGCARDQRNKPIPTT